MIPDLRGHTMGRLRSLLAPAVFTAVLLIVWELVVRAEFYPHYLFPGPLAVAKTGWGLVASGLLWPALWVSLLRLLQGFGLSLGLGAVLSFAIARWGPMRRAVQPYLLGLQSLPSIAWVPFGLLWFGFTEEALLFVTVMGSLFSIAMGFADALSTVPPVYYRAARNMGVSPTGLLLRVAVPSATPYLVSATKQGWSFAWRSLVGAEIVFATVGLGFLLNQGRELLDVPQMFAMMVMILVLGMAFERLLFTSVERVVRRLWGLESH